MKEGASVLGAELTESVAVRQLESDVDVPLTIPIPVAIRGRELDVLEAAPAAAALLLEDGEQVRPPVAAAAVEADGSEVVDDALGAVAPAAALSLQNALELVKYAALGKKKR